jgi:hypothetical protein
VVGAARVDAAICLHFVGDSEAVAKLYSEVVKASIPVP